MVDGVLMSVTKSKEGQIKVYLPVKVLLVLGWGAGDRIIWSLDENNSRMILTKSEGVFDKSNSTMINRFSNNSFQTTIPRAIANSMGFKHKSKALIIIVDGKLLLKRGIE